MKKRTTEEILSISQIYSQEVVKARVDNPNLDARAIFPLLGNI